MSSCMECQMFVYSRYFCQFVQFVVYYGMAICVKDKFLASKQIFGRQSSSKYLLCAIKQWCLYLGFGLYLLFDD